MGTAPAQVRTPIPDPGHNSPEFAPPRTTFKSNEFSELQMPGVIITRAVPKGPIKLGAEGPHVIEVQNLLNSKLPSQINVTGKYGSETMEAVASFQKLHKLEPNGIVDETTRKALEVRMKPGFTLEGITRMFAPWMEYAFAEHGDMEILGKDKGQDNSRVIDVHKTATLSFGKKEVIHDETPWCSSFVNYVMEKAGYKGTDSAGAKSWDKWGKEVKVPRLGDIVVVNKLRDKKDDDGKIIGKKLSNEYHVGFYMSDPSSKDKSSITIFGGNQSGHEVNHVRLGDRVSYSQFPLDQYRVISYRRPVRDETPS